MHLKIYIQGNETAVYSTDASGFQRNIFLDTVLGRLTYPYKDQKSEKKGLLSDWNFSTDYKTLKLTLDPANRFHNGRHILANDLDFSFTYHLLSNFETPESSGFKNVVGADKISRGSVYKPGMVDGFKVIDEMNFEIQFRNPEPHFLQNIRMPVFSVLPREELLQSGSNLNQPNRNSGSHIVWKDKPVGAGPYRVVNTSDDELVVHLEKNPFWRNRLGTSTIELITGNCPQDVDLAIGCSSNPSPNLLTHKMLDIPWVIFGLFFKYDSPLVRDPRFRRAVLRSIDLETLSLPNLPTQTIIPSNWSQWTKPSTRYNQEEARKLFNEVFSEYSPGKLAMSVTGGAKSRNNGRWIETIVESMAKAGCPIEILDPTDIEDHVHCFNVSGFIPSVSSIPTLFALFQEGSGWVQKLNHPDNTYNDLIENSRTDSTKTIQLNERFIEQAYAIPLFEEPVSCYLNEDTVASMNDLYQDISLMLHLVKPKKN